MELALEVVLFVVVVKAEELALVVVLTVLFVVVVSHRPVDGSGYVPAGCCAAHCAGVPPGLHAAHQLL